MKVLDFYADWCGPCQILKPILEEVEKEHPEVEFLKINIDEQQEIAEKYGVRFLDYYAEPSFMTHKEWFKEPMHLNREGARVFSRIIEEELRSEL